MKIVRTVFLTLLAVGLLAADSFASLGPMSLAEMIKNSDLVVVGTIVRTKVDGKHLAELEITQMVKGNPKLQRVYVYASPIWTCDISNAVENERGLFFLIRSLPDDPAGKALPAAEWQGSPILFITHSGWGRMIFKQMGGEDYVYGSRKGGVKFPGGLHYVRDAKAEDRDGGFVKLAEVLAYVRKRA